MPRDFYPRPEAKIVSFTANISQKVNSAPSDYGLSPERAADYALAQQAFATAYYAVHSNVTNSSCATVVKESARIELERETRMVVGIIKSQPTLTNEMRVELGLGPRPVRRHRIPRPEAPPILRVVETTGTMVKIQLDDAESLRRGKPRDVAGAEVYAFVGDQPPPTLAGWTFKRQTSHARVQVPFDITLPPGTKVWLTARWFNPRGQYGPACTGVFTHLGYGVALQRSRMRQAA